MSRRIALAALVLLALAAVSSSRASAMPADGTVYTLSGVVVDGGGQPVTGATVSVTAGVPVASGSTDESGRYSVPLEAGSYRLTIAGQEGGFEVDAVIDPLAISGDTEQDIALPPVGSVSLAVADAGDAPASGVSIVATGTGNVAGATQDGTPVLFSASPGPAACVTGADGVCSVEYPAGVPIAFVLTAPSGPPATASGAAWVGGNTVAVKLPSYASVGSAGSTPGAVRVSSAAGTTLSGVAAAVARAGDLPFGADPVVGAIAYAVHDLAPGATADVRLDLPAGSAATGLLRDAGASYVDAPADVSGDAVTVHPTDGGAGDADGAADGQIADVVVPIRRPLTPPFATRTTLAASAATLTYGSEGSEVFSVRVAAADGSVPTGKVTVKSGTTTVCTVTLAAGAGTCSPAATALAPGGQMLTASFPASARYLASTSDPVPVTVLKVPTHTTLSLSSPTASYGSEQLEVFSVQVTADDGTVPTGKVTVMSGSTTLCSVTLTAGAGSCSPSATALAAGDRTITATLPTSTRYQSSTSAPATLTILKVPTHTTMSMAPSPLLYGTAEVFSVAVAADDGSVPIGVVSVKMGTMTVCTATLSGGAGTCSPGPTVLMPGTRTLYASFPTSARYLASASDPASLTVLKVPTHTSLSLSSPSVTYGSENTEVFSVRVTADNLSVPTGKVTVKSGSTTLCTVTLAGGAGSCSPGATALAVGNRTITASFPSSTIYMPSTSDPAVLQIVATSAALSG